MSALRGRTSAASLTSAMSSARIGLLLVDLSDLACAGAHTQARRQPSGRAQARAQENNPRAAATPATHEDDALAQFDARLDALLAGGTSDDELLTQVCAAVRDALGWDEARFWPRDVLASTARAVRTSAPLSAGVGVVEQVFATGEPACMLDMADMAPEGADEPPDTLRGAVARSVFAFPARGAHLVGVIECLSATPRLPDAALLTRAAALGARIGACLEQRRPSGSEQSSPSAQSSQQSSQTARRPRARRGRREQRRPVDEVLAVAAHDLRTPITASRGYIQLAETQLKQVAHDVAAASPTMAYRLAQMRRYLEDAEQSTWRLARLVDRLLDAERLAAHKLELQRRVVDLAAIIRREVAEQRLAQPDRVIACDLEPARVVPALADPESVGQVLANYLANALKYSPDDSPVAVTLGVSDDEALVAVRDQGPGIAPEDQERIWQRFEQVQPTQPRVFSPGLGLGLYICRGIVEALGGRVGVESVLGRGSTFWFGLPLA